MKNAETFKRYKKTSILSYTGIYSTFSLASLIKSNASCPTKPCLILMCLDKASPLENVFSLPLPGPPFNLPSQITHLKIFFIDA